MNAAIINGKTITTAGRSIKERLADMASVVSENQGQLMIDAAKEIDRLQSIAKTRSNLLVKIFNSGAELPDDLMQEIQNHIDGR